MATLKSGERKLQILQTLAAMLGQPTQEKITTAALAKELAISEAALYRHFSGKAQMFAGLIDFIEETIFNLINVIAEKEESGLSQAQQIAFMLLQFAERNPGMARVLVGEALVHEDAALQSRMNQLINRTELAFRQALRTAILHKEIPEINVTAHADLLTCFIVGAWARFTKSGFEKKPLENAEAQVEILLPIE